MGVADMVHSAGRESDREVLETEEEEERVEGEQVAGVEAVFHQRSEAWEEEEDVPYLQACFRSAYISLL